MRSESLNYYDVLEVAPDADQESIYDAYCNAKKTFNLKDPEIYKIFSPEEAREWTELIEEAYSVIGFANSRRGYDQEKQKPTQQNLPSFEFSNNDEITENYIDESIIEDSLPEGYRETKFSRYEVVKSMEDLIAKQDSFDGLFLKKIREYKNIDLTDFSKITCIAIRHLYAIENNNFSVLPASVFVRGYIIQYCKILDLNEETVVPSFMALLSNA